MRGDAGNHHDKLELKKILCASQLTSVPDTGGIIPDLVGKKTNTWSSKPNQVSLTPDLSFPLVFSISFPC